MDRVIELLLFYFWLVAWNIILDETVIDNIFGQKINFAWYKLCLASNI